MAAKKNPLAKAAVSLAFRPAVIPANWSAVATARALKTSGPTCSLFTSWKMNVTFDRRSLMTTGGWLRTDSDVKYVPLSNSPSRSDHESTMSPSTNADTFNHSVSFIAERVSWIVNDSTTNA